MIAMIDEERPIVSGRFLCVRQQRFTPNKPFKKAKESMFELIFKTFIKDYENVKSRRVRDRYGKFAGAVGIISNIVLCIMKVVTGILAGSIAIVADGVNNLADASSSVITVIGFKLASLPEDESHPYGHARIEYLTSLVIAAVIIVVGIGLLNTSVEKVLDPVELDTSFVTFLVLILAILIKIWQSAFNRAAGRKIDSVALIATSVDSRNDVIATSAVLLSTVFVMVTGILIDGYMGCLVALFIIWSGIKLIIDSSSPLLGEAPDPEMVKSIVDIVKSYDDVIGIHDLMVHNYGPGRVFCSIHVEVNADEDIMKSHDMIDNIENEIQKTLDVHAVVHMDPIRRNDPRIACIHEVVWDAIKDLPEVLGMHDLRIVPGPTHTNIIFDCVLANGCSQKEPEIKALAESNVRILDPSYNVVITFDQNYTNLDEN